MHPELSWPPEAARDAASGEARWQHAGSNLCLDFHGDPCRARLAVFSDGNHHMALAQTLAAFLARHPGATDVFYATTPPGILVDLMRGGQLWLGNLNLSVRPHVFIGPEEILARLARDGMVGDPVPFMRSRGNALLVHRGNPKRIEGIADLLRPDVRLFISNPDTEAASYAVYRDTALQLAAEQGVSVADLAAVLGPGAGNTMFGQRIHHREAPAALAAGDADVAIVYYHLALRYVRIFPDTFALQPLGGTADDPRPSPAQVITRYACARVGDGGEWGDALLAFLGSAEVSDIYRRHGLARPQD